MSTSTVEEVDRGENVPRGGLSNEIRIDGAHHLGDVPGDVAPPDVFSPPSPEPASGDLLEQMRKQARQLAQHLLARQQDTDLREARTNAHQAALENEVRSERLWLLEQRATLAEQGDDLVRRECDLQERASQVSAAEEYLAHARKEFDDGSQRREEDLRQRVEQLDAVAARVRKQRSAVKVAQKRVVGARRQQQRSTHLSKQVLQTQREAAATMFRGLLEGIETRRARLAEQEESLNERETLLLSLCEEHRSRVQEEAARLTERWQHLELAEATFERQREEVREQQSLLAGQQIEWEARRRAEADQAASERQQWQSQLQKEQRAIERRSEELDERRNELTQLQASLRQLHKESLETRLAAEELLSQLGGAIPSAALTSSISRLRRRLDDQFRVAQDDLAQQRDELERLRANLAERHERLLEQKVELTHWVRQREETIEQQAARLVAREQELESQHEQLQTLQQRWHGERNDYQQQIRRLLTQLRQEESAESVGAACIAPGNG